MIEDASWILSPIEHRKHAYAEAEAWMAEPHDDGIERLAITNAPLDEWVCDWCNGDIPIMHEDKMQYVPQFLNNALCGDCLVKQVYKFPEAKEAFLAGKHPFVWWSHMYCGCPPCAEEALSVAPLVWPILKAEGVI